MSNFLIRNDGSLMLTNLEYLQPLELTRAWLSPGDWDKAPAADTVDFLSCCYQFYYVQLYYGKTCI